MKFMSGRWSAAVDASLSLGGSNFFETETRDTEMTQNNT